MLEILLVIVISGIGGGTFTFLGIHFYSKYRKWQNRKDWKAAGRQWTSTLQKMEDLGMYSVELGERLIKEAREGAFREDNRMSGDEVEAHKVRLALVDARNTESLRRCKEIDDHTTEIAKSKRQKRIEEYERVQKITHA